MVLPTHLNCTWYVRSSRSLSCPSSLLTSTSLYLSERYQVHFNDVFEFSTAVTQKMGLAVIGVLFEVSEECGDHATSSARNLCTGLKLVNLADL